MQTLILGSTSVFRQALLEKLHLPFQTAAPSIDETPLPNEQPEAMVKRLTLAKAQAVAKQHNQALIISSDQCAVIDDIIMGKPHNYDNAHTQLRRSSRETVRFLTGLCLYNAKNDDYQLDIIPFDVEFRELTDTDIHNYIMIEQPFQSAGSFKSEGLGISLFKRLKGEDPNTLIGLPLIRLCEMLRSYHIQVPPAT